MRVSMTLGIHSTLDSPAYRGGLRRHRFARMLLLVLFGLLAACGGPSAQDCARVCTEARQQCTDKSIDSCVSRCQSNASASDLQKMHCGGHSTCCGGLCCLGFYYTSYDQTHVCGQNATYPCL